MKTCTIICCFTFFLTAFCVMTDWKQEQQENRKQRAYEFLLSHPELFKPGTGSGPQVIIPRASAEPTWEKI